MAAPVNSTAWVEWMTSLMGGGSRQSYAASLPPDRFFCLLDDLPLHLIRKTSRHELLRQARDDRELIFNEECSIGPANQIPDEFKNREDLLSGFATQGNIVWVREKRSGSLLPFWVGPEWLTIVRSLQRGEATPNSASTKNLLKAAGILVNRERVKRARTSWEASVIGCSTTFREKGYTPISDLIHPFHVAALRRYYRCMIRTGRIALGDQQSQRRYVAHNEPVARFFHHQIASTVSLLTGKKLQPSYVYLASYLSGAELKRHTDREQCDFSVTLCLDFSPEPDLATPWPIHLDTPSGKVSVYQAIGDGLAYRGTELPHYREPLGQGQTSTSIFFHYVKADFRGSLD